METPKPDSTPRPSRSRQAAFTAKRKALGLCASCGNAPLRDSRLCLRHFLIKSLAARGLKIAATHRERVKRENLVSHILGRYTAIKAGYMNLPELDQVYQDVVEMRARLKISWGGIRGVRKMARIIHRIDRRANRERVIEQVRKETNADVG